MFSTWELDFLLDLEQSRLRKTSREAALRKYLRAVHQSQLDGAPEPPRLCDFLAKEFPSRSAASGGG